MDKDILTQTKLSSWNDWRSGFIPFELNGSLNRGWIGVMYNTGLHREDIQKPRDKILGWTKSAQGSGGSFLDLDYKCMDFTPRFIYLLVLPTLMKAKLYIGHQEYQHEWSLLSKSSGKMKVTNKQAVYRNSMWFML